MRRRPDRGHRYGPRAVCTTSGADILKKALKPILYRAGNGAAFFTLVYALPRQG